MSDKRTKRWWAVFEVLKNYTGAQDETERATDDVIAALARPKEPHAPKSR